MRKLRETKFTDLEFVRKPTPLLFAAVLSKFPTSLASAGIDLPRDPDHETMPYEAITEFLAGADPQQHRDLIYALTFMSLSTIPGNRALLEQELTVARVPRDRFSRYNRFDFPLAVWLEFPELLERAYGRAAVKTQRKLIYIPAFHPNPPQPRTLTKSDLATLTDRLATIYAMPVRLFFSEDERDGRLIIRRGDPFCYLECMARNGDSFSLPVYPAAYVRIMYSKKYGELRISEADRRYVRSHAYLFGDILFGDPNHFRESPTLVRTAPLIDPLNPCLDRTGFPDITDIRLDRIQYESVHGDLLSFSPQDITLFTHGVHSNAKRYPDVAQIHTAHLTFRLRTTKRPIKVTLYNGSEVGYIMDEDSCVVDDFLHQRQFILAHHVPVNERAA